MGGKKVQFVDQALWAVGCGAACVCAGTHNALCMRALCVVHERLQRVFVWVHGGAHNLRTQYRLHFASNPSTHTTPTLTRIMRVSAGAHIMRWRRQYAKAHTWAQTHYARADAYALCAHDPGVYVSALSHATRGRHTEYVTYAH